MQTTKDDLGSGDMSSQGGALAPQQGDPKKTTTKGPMRESTKKPKKETTMAYKKDTSQKIAAAASRVLKQQDWAAGTVAALEVVIAKLGKLRDDVQADGDLDYEDLMAISEAWRILDTIYGGYPMVPASEDVEKAATKKVAAKDFPDHAAAELEAAAGEPVEKRSLRIAALKIALASYDGAADEDKAEVPIVPPEAVVALLKGAAEAVAKMAADEAAKAAAAKAAGTDPPAPSPPAAVARIEAVAKAATAPPKVDWPLDLAARAPKPVAGARR